MGVQLCSTLCHPMDGSPRGFSIHGILLEYWLLLLLLLSHFSHDQLCVTPLTAAHQAPPSLGFSRQEHWSGLPFPSPMHANENEVAQSCPTLSGPPGSSVYRIFQARILELVAMSYSSGSPNLVIKPTFPESPAFAGRFFTTAPPIRIWK